MLSEHSFDTNLFRNELRLWGRNNFRAFLWRQTTDPYRILVAEIMLHRTQVRQVIPVYEMFLERYPTLSSLKTAQSDELESIFYPLGLHWRIPLFLDMISILHGTFDSEIPCKKEVLLTLPGVSDYIASAVRCFAWNKPDAIVDTNTVRIIARVYGIELKDSLRRNKAFKQRIADLVDPDYPCEFNYALLDLAHILCTKKREPSCVVCPVQTYCFWANRNLLTLI